MATVWPLSGVANASHNYFFAQNATKISSPETASYTAKIMPYLMSWPVIGFTAIWMFLTYASYHGGMVQIKGAPVVGRRGWWDSDLFLCWRYTANAKQILTEAYEKYKDTPFVMKRHDVAYNIMPHKYLDELRLVPNTKLSSIRANVQNLGHKWTKIDPMNESNLHFRVISNRLTPQLHTYLDELKVELDETWYDEFPNITDEWKEVDFQEHMRRFAARLAAKCFVGNPLCRDEDWIQISVGFAMDTFHAGAIVRMFPPFLHPFVARFIPTRYRVMKQIDMANKLMAPLLAKYKENKAKKARGEEVEADNTLFTWMMDHGSEKETQDEEMVIRQLFITLAAVHTSSMTVSHMMFDLCAHPEWFEVFRKEVDDIAAELGPIGSSPESGTKAWLARLDKMDSFFVESQRLHLPTLFVPQRIAVQQVNLKDGTVIPKGCKITWAGDHYMNETFVNPEPEKFDPLRAYRKREADPDPKTKNLATSVSSDRFSFGYGGQACPGRFFSVAEVKLLLARLIEDYDFMFTDGTTNRPETLYVGENAFPNPAAKLLMRKRQKV